MHAVSSYPVSRRIPCYLGIYRENLGIWAIFDGLELGVTSKNSRLCGFSLDRLTGNSPLMIREFLTTNREDVMRNGPNSI